MALRGIIVDRDSRSAAVTGPIVTVPVCAPAALVRLAVTVTESSWDS